MSANSLGCREHPFGPGFDSRYFFVRPGQEGSFRELLARISARDGLVLVSGQTGTGKTALLHELIAELQATNAVTLFFPSPAPTSDALLDACLEQLGLSHSLGVERSQKLRALADSLRRSNPARSVVLLADEGHALTDDVLNTLLKLSALDVQGRKLLPVVVAGEPMLEGRLAEDRFLPLAGSIGYRYHLAPLAKEDVASFIEHRMRAAGCAVANPFSAEAVNRVAYYSDGLPARINQLGDIALFIATLESKQQITEDVVERAACDALLAEEPLGLGPLPPAGEPPLQPYDPLSGGSEVPVLTDVANVPGQVGPPAAAERQLTAAELSSRFAGIRLDTGQDATPSWSALDASAPDPETIQDLTLDDSDPEPGTTTAHGDLRSFDALHGTSNTAVDTAAPAPRGNTRRSPWVRRTVIAVGLSGIVVTTGWLWSTSQHRLHELRPLIAKLDTAIQLGSDRLQSAMADLRAGVDSMLEQVTNAAREPVAALQNPGPLGPSLTVVDNPTPPVSAPEVNAAAKMATPPSTPELPLAPRPPTSPTASQSYELASWSATCRLLTRATVRERPAVHSRSVAMLQRDTNVLVTGRVPGSNWYRVRADAGQEGFVYAGIVPKPRPPAGSSVEPGSPALGLLQLDEAEAASTEIAQLLALAGHHLRADRLMAPRFDNALAVYRKVLRADPKNEDALAGIDGIKAKLMGFVRDAVARGDMDTARNQINKVLVIDAEDRAARTALAKFGEAVPFADFAGLEERAPAR